MCLISLDMMLDIMLTQCIQCEFRVGERTSIHAMVQTIYNGLALSSRES